IGTGPLLLLADSLGGLVSLCPFDGPGEATCPLPISVTISFSCSTLERFTLQQLLYSSTILFSSLGHRNNSLVPIDNGKGARHVPALLQVGQMDLYTHLTLLSGASGPVHTSCLTERG